MGIALGSDFDVSVALPLDSRIVKANIAARDAIPSGTRYLGLIVYVESEEKLYSLTGGITNDDWIEVGSGASGGGGSKNYFDTESSTFEDGTIGGWVTAKEEDIQIYENTVDTSFQALSNTQRYAQKVILSNDIVFNTSISLYENFLDPPTGSFTVSLREDDAGKPSDTSLVSVTRNSSTLGASAALQFFDFSSYKERLTGTYWIVIDCALLSSGKVNVVRALSAITGEPDSASFLSGSWNTLSEQPVTLEINGNRRSASSGLTLGVTTTSGEVLEKTTSISLVKAGANHTLEFAGLLSQAIDPIDRGKVNFGSFAFKPISGYVSGDLIVEVYDVTNSAVLYSGQAEDLELLNVTDPITFNYVAYLESTTAQIELRLKVNNTNTNGFTIVFDEFKFGPAAVLPTTFERYEEITLVNSGANNISGTVGVGRTGNQVSLTLIDLTFTSSSAPITATSVLPSWARSEKDFLSNVSMSNGTVMTRVYVADTGAIGLIFYNYSGTETAQTSVDNLTISYTVPSTPHTMTTNELGLQNMTVVAGSSGGNSYASGTTADLVFETVTSDNFSAYNSTTGIFTAPKSGLYSFNIQTSFQSLSPGTGQSSVIIANTSNTILKFSRSPINDTDQSFSLDTSLELTKGEQVKIRLLQTNGANRTTNTTATLHHLIIKHEPDLTLIGAVRNDEYLEAVATTSYTSAGVSPSTWAVPTTAFNLTLPEGVWDIEMFGPVQGFSAAGTFYANIALATSTTPGSGIIAQGNHSMTHDTLGANRYGVCYINKRNYVVTSPVTLYVHHRPINIGSLTTATMLYGDTGNSDFKITARRVK